MSNILDGFTGKVPPDVDIEKNIQEVLDATRNMSAFEKAQWLREKVGPGKDWDYKREDKVAIANGTFDEDDTFGAEVEFYVKNPFEYNNLDYKSFEIIGATYAYIEYNKKKILK